MLKLKAKNRGNRSLCQEIDTLIECIQSSNWKDPFELINIRPDADKVHNEGFYFFDLDVHRTLIMIEFNPQEANVVWVGSHQEYDRKFRGNKKVIESWLRANEWIE